MGSRTVADAVGLTVSQVAPPGYAPLGDVLSIGFDPPNHPVRWLLRTLSCFWDCSRMCGRGSVCYSLLS